MRCLLFSIALAVVLATSAGYAAERHRTVVVADPFIELHTGPGRGYPVFYIAERGEQVQLLKQRTDWFEVRLQKGKTGWVRLDQLRRTLQPNGEHFDVSESTLSDYARRRWEVGVLYGDFGGANEIASYGAFSLTPNLSFELALSEVLGRFSDSKMVNLDIVHTLFPARRISPYFGLGTGTIDTLPKATLVATLERRESLAHVGFGFRAYLTRRFVFKAEYKTYVVFTHRDDNEDIREWKAGFSLFF